MYDFADDLLEIGHRLLDLTTKLSLGEQTPQRVISFCLLGRIVDLSSASAALLKSHDVAGIPHLVRGQLEAYADLRNLTATADYIANMEAAYCAEVERVLKAVAREGIATGLPDVSGSLKVAQDRLAELKKQGASPLNVADRFRKAGLISEYYSVYAYLCSHSHNNVGALENRHIDKTKDPHQLLILLDAIDAELAILIELSIKIPLAGLGILLQGESGPVADEYAVLCADFEEARKKWAPLLAPSEPPAV